MAKNRVMQEKNARVRKADAKNRKEMKLAGMSTARSRGEMSDDILLQMGYVPNYGTHEREIAPSKKVIVKKYKTIAKTELMARI